MHGILTKGHRSLNSVMMLLLLTYGGALAVSAAEQGGGNLLVNGEEYALMPDTGSIPYNPAVRGRVLHGDGKVTFFDSKTNQKLGTDTIHFHLNYGLKLLGAENLSKQFGNRYFKVDKKDEKTVLLTVIADDPKIGQLKIEVFVKLDATDIEGKTTLTKPDKTQDIKLFKGKFQGVGEGSGRGGGGGTSP